MVLGGFRSFHVLVTTNKSKFDGYSVRKRVLMISRITFGIVMCTFFSDNLSQNSCMRRKTV